jgi:hypothetical protein
LRAVYGGARPALIAATLAAAAALAAAEGVQAAQRLHGEPMARVGAPVLSGPPYWPLRPRAPNIVHVLRPVAPARLVARWRAQADAAGGARDGLRGRAVAAPRVLGVNRDGVGQVRSCGFCMPPDTDGSAGLRQYVQVTNTHIDMYAKRRLRRLRSVSLNAFFRTRAFLFDPRVAFDARSRRWIVTADADPRSPAVQSLFIAVSRGPRATGRYWISRIDTDDRDDNSLFDYPQLGFDRGALIITGDVFSNGGVPGAAYLGSDVIVIRKERAYAGRPFVPLRFRALARGTIAPPRLIDREPVSYLLQAQIAGARNPARTLNLWSVERSGVAQGAVITALPDVPVREYSLPPLARQSGTRARIDTLDGRFVNATTQESGTLWQVHTINVGGRARPRYYRIDAAASRVIRSGTLARSSTSDDWNASIAANVHGRFYLTWSSADAPAHVPPQIRFTGRRQGGPPQPSRRGALLHTSPSVYHPDIGQRLQRWGDYSSVSIDPYHPERAWIVNEYARSQSAWASRIGRIGF